MSRLDRILVTTLLFLAAFWACREADYLRLCRRYQADIVVSVSGAVKEPGVVRLPAGARAVHAINRCGGLAADAQAEVVPLARELKDGENLLVPRRPAARISVEPRPLGTEDSGWQAEPTQPAPEPPATDVYGSAGSSELDAAPSRRRGTGRAAKGAAAPPAGPFDINRATLEELDSLPGIGPVTARRILQARQASAGGSFSSLEELGAIRGIKGKTFLRLKPYLKIEGP